MSRYMTMPEIRQLLTARDKVFLAEHSVEEGVTYLSQCHGLAETCATEYLAYLKTRNGSSPALGVERIQTRFASIPYPLERAPKREAPPEPRSVEVVESRRGRRDQVADALVRVGEALVEVQKTSAQVAASAESAARAAQAASANTAAAAPRPEAMLLRVPMAAKPPEVAPRPESLSPASDGSPEGRDILAALTELAPVSTESPTESMPAVVDSSPTLAAAIGAAITGAAATGAATGDSASSAEFLALTTADTSDSTTASAADLEVVDAEVVEAEVVEAEVVETKKKKKKKKAVEP